jgi:anti-sigma B factor antagonist
VAPAGSDPFRGIGPFFLESMVFTVRIQRGSPTSLLAPCPVRRLTGPGVRRACPGSKGSTMLNFTTNELGGILIIALEPTDAANYDWQSTQREYLYKLIESREDPRFAIDLSEINYLASSEIGFLVTIKRRIDRRKGKVVFFGISPYLAEIFRTTNLTRVLDIVGTRTEALAKLKS